MRPRITRQQNPGPSSSQLHLSLELPRHDEQYENNDGINGAAVPVLKHILNVTGAKLPIKRSDIAKLCAGGNAELMVVITQVRNWLNDIYGYSLIEVNEEKNHFFLCVVKFMGYSYGDLGEEQQKIARLLFIVLSYIYMKGETVLEGPLFHFLQMSGVDKGDAHDSGPFGDVRKLITDTFIRQMYLKRDKVVLESGGHEERYQYQWGTRALHEFPKKDILDSVANIMNRPTIMFKKQHMEIYGNVGEPDSPLNADDTNNDDDEMDSS